MRYKEKQGELNFVVDGFTKRFEPFKLEKQKLAVAGKLILLWECRKF